MRSATRTRLVAILALVALLCATTAMLVHGHEPGAPHEAIHCDLCLQFGGNVGAAPARPALAVPGLVLLLAAAMRRPLRLPAQRRVAHAARAPPLARTI